MSKTAFPVSLKTIPHLDVFLALLHALGVLVKLFVPLVPKTMYSIEDSVWDVKDLVLHAEVIQTIVLPVRDLRCFSKELVTDSVKTKTHYVLDATPKQDSVWSVGITKYHRMGVVLKRAAFFPTVDSARTKNALSVREDTFSKMIDAWCAIKIALNVLSVMSWDLTRYV